MMANLRTTSHDAGSPSVDEAISWLLDAILAAGVVGYSDDYIAPQVYLQNWAVGHAGGGAQEAADDTLDLNIFLNESHAEESLRQERVAIVNGNRLLRQEAKREVRRKLLAAGKSEKDIEEIGTSPTLTTMVRYLSEVQNPKPLAIGTIWCRVCTGLPGTVGCTPMRLPVNASVQVIYDLLRMFVSTELLCASTQGIPDAELEEVLSAWRYQILVAKANGRFALKPKSRASLVDNASCRDLIKKVTEGGRQILFPLLTPVVLYS